MSPEPPVTVATVLRSGGPYTPAWVWALKRGFTRHMSVPFRFVCLSDVEGIGMWRIPLTHDWPGWWAKLELFDPEHLTGTVLYVDLDTLVVGDPAELTTYKGDLALLSNLYGAEHARVGKVEPDEVSAQSGIMIYRAGPGTVAAEIFDRWTSESWNHWRQRYRGDGEWLHAHTLDLGPDRIQDLYPGHVVSYKIHARTGPPDGARLCAAHGKPKWDDPRAGWAHRAWSALT